MVSLMLWVIDMLPVGNLALAMIASIVKSTAALTMQHGFRLLPISISNCDGYMPSLEHSRQPVCSHAVL